MFNVQLVVVYVGALVGEKMVIMGVGGGWGPTIITSEYKLVHKLKKPNNSIQLKINLLLNVPFNFMAAMRFIEASIYTLIIGFKSNNSAPFYNPFNTSINCRSRP